MQIDKCRRPHNRLGFAYQVSSRPATKRTMAASTMLWLRTLELVQGRGELRASDNLFDSGAA